jgi:hypothetical protein
MVARAGNEARVETYLKAATRPIPALPKSAGLRTIIVRPRCHDEFERQRPPG